MNAILCAAGSDAEVAVVVGVLNAIREWTGDAVFAAICGAFIVVLAVGALYARQSGERK